MRSQTITIQANATVNCSIAAMTTRWSLYPIGEDIPVYQTNTSHVIIPGRSLSYGLYVVNVTVRIQGLPVTGHAKGYIHIRPGSLVAVIKGGSYVKGADNITLDASDSFDADTGSSLGLSYNWLCWSNQDSFPYNALEYPVVKIPSPVAWVSWYNKGGCYDTGVGLLPTFGPKLVLNVSYMKPQNKYYVGLMVKKGQRQSMVMHDIDLTIDNTMQLAIR